ncbi:MAG: hypothetical protein JOZ86_13920 [Candidatus Eremiobacteraeota bacterium]|nr:hypothetical protein [Candidatus Eremiobacteraeota bacterium]
MERTIALRSQITAGLVAGIVAGIVMDAAYLAMQYATGVPAEKLLGLYVFVASAVLGPSAYGNPNAIGIGIVLHFCVAVGWALGYVYLVRTQPQLLRLPWLSGAVFGLVVYVFMQLVLLYAGIYHRPASPAELAMQLLAHLLFYGTTVALVVSLMLRRA